MQLVAADIKSNFCPVVILTDLDSIYHFFWFGVDNSSNASISSPASSVVTARICLFHSTFDDRQIATSLINILLSTHCNNISSAFTSPIFNRAKLSSFITIKKQSLLSVAEFDDEESDDNDDNSNNNNNNEKDDDDDNDINDDLGSPKGAKQIKSNKSNNSNHSGKKKVDMLLNGNSLVIVVV